MNQNRLIDVAAFNPRSLQFPNAWVGHLPFAAWSISEISPKIFVELGTHSGNSYFSFCQGVKEFGLNTKCYAVDTWQGDEHAGEYSDEIFNYVNGHNEEHYAKFSQLMRRTFDDAVSYFSDGAINLLHIDGLHTYEAVSHDFETWLPKLAPGAVVIFHDTNVHERNFGVWQLWQELQARYPNSLEFVHSHGLGVLQLNDAPDDKKITWLQQDSPEKLKLSNYFASLGSHQLQRYELNLIKSQVMGLEGLVSKLNQNLMARSAEIDKLNKSLAEQDDKVDMLNKTLVDRDSQIDKLNKTLSERDGQIGKLNQVVTQQDSQIANLNNSINERDAHISKLTKTISGHEAQIASFRQSDVNATNLSQALTDIHESTCWRITAPIRLVGRQILRSRIIFQAIPYAVSMCGGYRGLIKHIWKTYNQEGLQGIKLRIFFSAARSTPNPVFETTQAHSVQSVQLGSNNYSEWLRRYDNLTDETRSGMRSQIGEFTTPLISIIMPTYNTEPEWLIEAIESVKKQIYPNWELCIADDASTDKTTRTILKRYAKEDARIKVVFRKQNGHISAASNSALELATGEWIALLDHDDLLTEHALFWVVDAINKNPDISLIYSDEDKIESTGKRFDPYFKCDWNIDLFYSHNLVTHLGVYRSELLHKIGGFRIGFEGAQDYDLVLRFIEHIDPRQIHHIPRVLYHWRFHPGSTAQSSDAKPYAMLAGEKALNEHLERKGIAAKAELVGHGFRVRYQLPDSPPLVSLIIPTRNGYNLLKQCIDSLLEKTVYPNFEIIVVDNGSDEPDILQYFQDLTTDQNKVRVIHDNRPFNYSALNNAAAKQARGELIGLINNDIEVISPDWLCEMVSHVLRPDVGVVGACLWYPNNTLQHGGVILGIGGWAGHAHKGFKKGQFGYLGRMSLISEFTAVTGACMLTRKSLFDRLGGLNEVDLQVACNDVDYCLRVRDVGYRCVWTPYAELYHHESATRGYEDTPEKQLRFQNEVKYMRERWEDIFKNDPAYSPNLTLDREDFSYAWPPRVG